MQIVAEVVLKSNNVAKCDTEQVSRVQNMGWLRGVVGVETHVPARQISENGIEVTGLEENEAKNTR